MTRAFASSPVAVGPLAAMPRAASRKIEPYRSIGMSRWFVYSRVI